MSPSVILSVKITMKETFKKFPARHGIHTGLLYSQPGYSSVSLCHSLYISAFNSECDLDFRWAGSFNIFILAFKKHFLFADSFSEYVTVVCFLLPFFCLTCGLRSTRPNFLFNF